MFQNVKPIPNENIYLLIYLHLDDDIFLKNFGRAQNFKNAKNTSDSLAPSIRIS